MMRDPYTVLGVGRNASQEDIKKAYRKLAKDLHPDRHPGDSSAADRFKEVSAAYNLLGDVDQRARYDRGEIGPDGQERMSRTQYRTYTGPEGGEEGFGGFHGGGARGFEDIFGDIFTSFRGGRQQARGRDRKYTLDVSFLEAARGANRRLTLPGGKTLDVRIPAGLEDGQQIRLKGQGDAPPGGAPGDALIEVSVKPHPLYTRRGQDIHIELPISLTEAVLGAKIKAPTIHGDVTVTVPEGSNTGRTLRLKGKGIVNRKSGQDGDQYVRLKIVLPDGKDPELQQFVKSWSRGEAFDARADLKTD
ncbi:MAG: molecular chaperone DnaJ [Rhizobiales bacterium NRL2]|jgi:DnaJ-class molecular chaperone|nr:MAG: molecular chaperone DnaJ [Rhizobiales bacterium NRL2]